MADVQGIDAERLTTFIERVERLEEEKKGISDVGLGRAEMGGAGAGSRHQAFFFGRACGAARVGRAAPPRDAPLA